MTTTTDAHVITPPIIRATWNGIQVNVLDMYIDEDELFMCIKVYLDARTRWLTVRAGTLEQITPMFNAHGHRWTVHKEINNYSLYRWDGIIPRFVCMSGLDKFALALRHLAERATRITGRPAEYFEFLYAWMERE